MACTPIPIGGIACRSAVGLPRARGPTATLGPLRRRRTRVARSWSFLTRFCPSSRLAQRESRPEAARLAIGVCQLRHMAGHRAAEPKPKPVSQEARQRMSRAQRSRHLTARQERFVKPIAHLPQWPQRAARAAGYSDGPGVGQTRLENLKKANVKAALSEDWRMRSKITPGRVQRRLDEISHEARAPVSSVRLFEPRNCSVRSVGMFIDRAYSCRPPERQPHRCAPRTGAQATGRSRSTWRMTSRIRDLFLDAS